MRVNTMAILLGRFPRQVAVKAVFLWRLLGQMALLKRINSMELLTGIPRGRSNGGKHEIVRGVKTL